MDDTLYRRARIFAASTDTSVSALVREFLNQLTKNPDEKSEETEESHQILEIIKTIRSRHPGFDPANRLTRDEVHSR